MKNYLKIAPLLLIFLPIFVLAIGGTKRIIDLPGFTADRLLYVNSSNELDGTGITVGGSANELTGIASLNGITSTTLGYVDFTSSGQTQLNAKLDDFAGTADNALVRTNGTGGDSVQESGIIVDDSNNLSGIEVMTLEGQASTPTSPSAGSVKFYSKSADEKLYYLNSSGLEQEVGSGAGGGAVNYYGDFQADTISNVAEFDDSAGSAIVDGTGGSPVSDLAAALETSAPLSGDNSYKLSKSGSTARQWMGWSIDSDTPDRTSTTGGETVYVTFNYETSANFATGDVGIYVYRIGSNTLEACNSRNVLSGSFSNELPKADDVGQYQCVTTLSSSDTGVRVIFGIIASTTTNWDLVVDKIKIGPDATVTAPIVTEWESTSLTWGNRGTLTFNSDTASYRRVGDSIEVQWTFNVSGGTGTAAQLTFDLPNGLTIDTTKISSDVITNVGFANWYDNSGSTSQLDDNWMAATVLDTNTIRFMTPYDSGFIQGAAFAASDRFSGRIQVPVTQFANANAILSTTQVDFSTLKVVAKTASVPTASPGLSNTVNSNIIYGTEVTDTHNAYNPSTGVFTVPESGYYDIDATTHLSGTYASAGVTQILIEVDGTAVKSESTYINAGSSTYQSAAISLLGYYLTKGQTVNIAVIPEAWSSISFVSDASRHWFTVKASPNFSTFSTYGVYEYTEAECSTTSATGSATTFADVAGASVSLTPGTWQVCYDISLYMVRVAGSTVSCQSIIRDGSNNLVSESSKLHYFPIDATYSSMVQSTMSCAEVTITTPTTYKLSMESSQASSTAYCQNWCDGTDFTSGLTAPDGTTKIWARRMK